MCWVLSGETWQSVRLQGIGKIAAPTFFFDGKTWYYLQSGSVTGIVRSANNAMPEILLDLHVQQVMM